MILGGRKLPYAGAEHPPTAGLKRAGADFLDDLGQFIDDRGEDSLALLGRSLRGVAESSVPSQLLEAFGDRYAAAIEHVSPLELRQFRGTVCLHAFTAHQLRMDSEHH